MLTFTPFAFIFSYCICIFFPELFEGKLQTWHPYTPHFCFLKAKTVHFMSCVFYNLKSFSVFVLFPDIDILKNTDSYFVEWPSIWTFVFSCLQVSQWNIFLSVRHIRRHMMSVFPIMSDFNSDHSVKAASSGFFLLINMYLVEMYFKNV